MAFTIYSNAFYTVRRNYNQC